MPKLPSLQAVLFDTWVIRCEAAFSTTKITVSKTKVEYAVAVILSDVQKRCQMRTVYSDADPWAKLKSLLESVLGDDPLAVSRSLYQMVTTLHLAWHADVSQAFKSLTDIRSTALEVVNAPYATGTRP